ncbi:MAG: glycoside hydrolase family 3 N-terminal domain-containing protein [Acidobacteriota bacterium]|nr:glycoside hydrolase family 3 C-terminal domain-containing protein [Blastocatellia bacterium]MDW8239268.1 glycoside hydrolase family 3 N-terminal domain-containing protein [Acidobacteriota bacterium]
MNNRPSPRASAHQQRLTSVALVMMCLVVGLLLASMTRAYLEPSGNTIDPKANEIERKIDALLARMTLEEKLGQLQQLDGHADGRYREEHPELIRRGLLGATLNVRGAKRTNELQRIAVEQSRLKIPVLFGFDVIHGYRTIFPVPLGEASSWDPVAVERAAAIAAAESRAAGVHWTFAPMVDIARDPRWGRIVEGAGEDPYLGSVMAQARVRGFQGQDYSAPDKVVACAKHWVAYGAAEAGRDYNTTDMSEWTLREIYFPPFKAAVEAGVGTLMTAFNDLNGVPATANPFTLTKVLRGEWQFDGFVVSDYTAVEELIKHGLATDGADAAQLALNAGTDMEMVSRLYNQHGPQLLRSGQLSMKTIDEAVRRILRIKFRLGLFDQPYADETRERAVLLNPAHVAAARQVAARSMVLLKNDGNLLPLSKNLQSLAIIGPLADDQAAPLGSWSGDGRKEDVVTVLAGIRAKVSPNTRIHYAKGCDIDGDSTDGLAEAVRAARQSDIALVVVGESAEMSGEAASRTSLDLPGRQLDLVKAIHATGRPVVVVLMNGRPLTINWIAENVPAILETWFAGIQAGHAIADVLFGDVNPGGKLPVTFPRHVGQVPLYYNHKNTGRPPDVNNKYTSKYLDAPWTPLFPFGYGLSYTTFALSNLQLSHQRIPTNGRLTVSVDVQNTGQRAGDEVVQLYIRDVVASVTRPVRELKGFQRITLQPGETRRVQFTLGPEHLGFYNRQMRFVVEPGEFIVFVGNSSVGGLQASFFVQER